MFKLKYISLFIPFSVLMIFVSCAENEKLFTLVDSSSGLYFNNSLNYNEEFNPYIYRNFYNGGGVAVGDINNDGLEDIYFTGNLVDNKLFLNKGNFQFEDITEQAGVACSGVWSTGATFVDINGDGFLDLYVCKSGPPEGNKRHNELFINNGDFSFSERSKEYNLDILGLSVQAAFFDFDLDGDLDCYILNNSFRTVGGYDLIKDKRLIPDSNGQGNKLLENVGGKFKDITLKAGIFSSDIGFGLGITLSDFNNDGWTDLYISNDFFEKDYLYINNQDKTFTEVSDTYFSSLSLGSMGADSADLDNDLLTDLFVTEMLPKSLKRKKTKAVYDSWDKHELAVKNGYHYQYPRNMLQRNFGNNQFFEIGRFAGLDASEWSWASMMFDLNNDGLKDIFISNGIYKDLLDRDYLNYMSNQERIANLINTEKEVIKKLIDIIPSSPVKNQVYLNHGNFLFEEITEQYGFNNETFSNGLAYSDLDNDGDLDIIINNVNMPSYLYKNNSKQNKSLQIVLKGEEKNKNAIGAKVILKYGNGKQAMLENFPSRGFQSSVTQKLHFGIGKTTLIDSVFVFWPNKKASLHLNLSSDSIQKLEFNSGIEINKELTFSFPLKKPIIVPFETIDFEHSENNFSDFNKERLLYQMFSNEGPDIAISDVNNDGKEDVFITGAKNQSSVLFSSNKNGFIKSTAPFENFKSAEDVKAVFFDSDNDGDKDLYIGSGGKSFSIYDQLLNDRFYENNGKGNFQFLENAFKFKTPFPTGAVAVADFNNDGLVDIFIGERYNPEAYGIPVSGHLFLNQGNNNFNEIEHPNLENLGLITQAKWVDINQDGLNDLIVAGEWMPIKIFINNGKTLEDKTIEYNLSKSNGLWKDIEFTDIDFDGDLDFIAANIGLNSFIKPNMRLYINDFDGNGTYEQILCEKIGTDYFPVLDKDDLIEQLPILKKNLFYYSDYASLSIDQIFDKEILETSITLEINEVETSIFINDQNRFIKYKLPEEINYSVVHDIELLPNTSEKKIKMLLGGNQFKVKPQYGKLDASKGWLIEFYVNNDSLQFTKPISLEIGGQIRKFALFQKENKQFIISGINNEKIKSFILEE